MSGRTRTGRVQVELALRGLRQERDAPADFAAKAENLRRTDDGAWAECRGTRRITADLAQDPFVSPSSVGQVETLTTFAQHSGRRRWTVFELATTPSATSLNLVYFDGSQRTYVNIVGSRRLHRGPWEGTRYTEINGWLYFLNGYDPPERWNGRYRHRIGFDMLPARPHVTFENNAAMRDYIYPEYPLTDDTIGTNGLHRRGVGPWCENYDGTVAGAVPQVLPWVYGYVVTYVNDLGYESPPSPVAIVAGTNRSADTTAPNTDTDGRTGPMIDLPDAPQWAKGWRLYRTRNMYGLDAEAQFAQRYYLHTECQSRMKTTLSDLKPDEELGRELDELSVGLMPAGVRRMVVFANRAYLSGHDANRLRYSPRGKYEQFPSVNDIVVGSSTSGAIMGVFVTRSALLVFTERGVHMVLDDGQNEPFVRTIHETEGLAAPRAICEVPGQGIAFVSQDGVRILVGGDGGLSAGVDVSVYELGATKDFPTSGIRDAWVKVNRGALVTADVVVNTTDREVWFMVPVDGAVRPNHVFVWHYETQDWTERPYWPFNCAVEIPDHARPILLGGAGASEDTRGLHVYTSQVETIAGAERIALYRTNKNVVDRIGQRYDVRELTLFGQTLGNIDVDVLYWTDRRTQAAAEVVSMVQVDREDDSRPLWGTDTWSSTALWSEYDASEFRQAVATRHSGMGYQVQFTTSTRIRLVRLALDVHGDGLNRSQGDEA